MPHYHTILNGHDWGLFRTKPVGGAPGRECCCESGELDLFHEGVEWGEIDEQCPCDDCQAQRNKRFKAWREQQERAEVVRQHTRAGEAGPDV